MALSIEKVISEVDIFKYAIPREDTSNKVIIKNMGEILSRIPENIFSGIWSGFYDIIFFAYKYNIPLGYDQFHQIILLNTDKFLEQGALGLNTEDENLSKNDLRSMIQDTLLVTYEDLLDSHVESFEEQLLLPNMELYIEAWSNDAYLNMLQNEQQILQSELKVGRKTYSGTKDAINYHSEVMEYINAIVDKDIGRLSESINTLTDTPEEIKAKFKEEETGQAVASTGIASFDESIVSFSKGELVVIQAGSGVGKTRFSSAICYNGMTEYMSNVLYISLEQKSTRIFPMFMAREIANEKEVNITHLTDNEIIKNTYAVQHQQYVDKSIENLMPNSPNKEKEQGAILIEGRSIFGHELKQYMTSVWDNGFHFDILVLDYIGLIDVQENRYNDITATINMLKSECKNFKGEGFLAIVPNQLKPDVEEELIKGNSDMSKLGGAESQAIVRASDYVLTLAQTPEQRKDQQMHLISSKIRLGTPLEPILLDVSLGNLLFSEAVIEEDDEDY